MSEIRNRNPNYTKDEQILLLHVLQQYKYIIENKKTDHVTWKEKDNAWNEIANKFNASSETDIFRCAESLRIFFDNIKKKTRKEAAEQKNSLKKTGGGEGHNITDSTFDLTLSLMNTKSVYGSNNNFDSDSNVEQSEIIELTEIQNTVPDKNIIIMNDAIDVHSENESVRATNIIDWSNSKATNLKEPRNKKLVSVSTPTRRRPSPVTSTARDELVEMYKQVGRAKLEYFTACSKNLEEKRQRENEEHYKQIKREEEEHKLKQELLLLKIKESKLKNM